VSNILNGIPINFDKVVFLENEKVADYFVKNLYPYHSNFIIMTADKKYPKDESLNKKMWNLLETDKNVTIAVLGRGCAKALSNVKSERIYVLDHLLAFDMRKLGYGLVDTEYNRNKKINFNKVNFMNLIHTTLINNKNQWHHQSEAVDGSRAYSSFEIDDDCRSVPNWKAVLISNISPNEIYQVDDELTWEEIEEVWRKELWPGRRTPIKQMSSMTWIQPDYIDTDMEIYKKYKPTFFGVRDPFSKEIVGVNSGHRTDDTTYRSRGLWVNQNFRGKKIGQILLQETIHQAKKENCKWIWTCPRKKSLKTYQNASFKRKSDWFDEGMEFGPNCIAARKT
jgi:GNAT superfamily N-acetyltransferase